MFQNKKATVFLELLGGNGNEEDSEMKRRQTKKLKLKSSQTLTLKKIVPSMVMMTLMPLMML